MNLHRILSAAVAGCALTASLAAAQTPTPVQNLPAASTLDGTEMLFLRQGSGTGSSKRTSPSQLLAYIRANGAATTSAAGVIGPLTGNATDCIRGNGSISACPSGGSGGSGGGLTHPGYRSGEFYRITPTTGTSNNAVNANRLYAIPILNSSASGMVIASLGLHIQTAAAAGSTCYVGVYGNTSGRAGALLASVVVPTDAPGGVSSTALSSAYTLAGNGWAAVLCSAGPTVQATGFGDNLLAAFVGGGSAPAVASAANAGIFVDTPYSGGLPATFPASYSLSGGGFMPLPYFRPQ